MLDILTGLVGLLAIWNAWQLTDGRFATTGSRAFAPDSTGNRVLASGEASSNHRARVIPDWQERLEEGMRHRALTAAMAAAIALRCSPPLDELPEVKTPSFMGQRCIEPLKPITSSAVPSLMTTDIGSCVRTAWASRCTGSMSFEADVDNVGKVKEIRYTGDASPELRRCIREILAKPVPVPHAECPDTQGTTILSGGIRWPKNSGTFIHLAGDSAIIPCLRDCTGGGGAGGPTSVRRANRGGR